MKRLLIVLLAFALPAGAASIDVARQNFLDYYTATGASRDDQHVRDALGWLEGNARQDVAPGFLLADGSWSDINYHETPGGSWSPGNHFGRLLMMAKAYRTPGQSLYNDPQLLAQIEAGLAYVPTFYGTRTLPTGNWWFWSIGAPLDLGPTLVLMRGAITQTTYDACVKTLAFHIGSGPTSRGLTGPVPVGENLVWSCYTHLCLGLLKDDANLLGQVRDAMAGVCQVTTDDGIQADRSFHQHGPQLYTGGYGGAFAYDVSQYVLLTRNTEFVLPPAALGAFADYLADGVVWSLYGSYFDVSVMGREAVRQSASGANGMYALLQASQFDSPRAAELREAATKMLASWQWTLPPELAAIAANLSASRALAAWPSGHRHYFQSDYTVHRRPGWFASVKMFSTRTKSGESTNDENLLGSRQSDGRFYLVFDGDEYFDGDVRAALDWTRLPGITVERKPDAADATYGFGKRNFVGGVGDDAGGVSAMDYAPLNATLTAKKSWFFFDDSIVFLTNSIEGTLSVPVETIVEQWPLRDPAAPLDGFGNWLACDGIGYWFPNGMSNLRIDRSTHSGTWAALGGSTDATPRSASFLTLRLDHGLAPVAADAAYAIVPGATAQSMGAWAASNHIVIVQNDARASAVRRDGIEGIVFWAAGIVDGVQCDAPAIVYLKTAGDWIEVYATDPTNATSGSFHVTIGATRVEVPRNGGRTFHITLAKPRMRRRAG